jgi:hypothetical protein
MIALCLYVVYNRVISYGKLIRAMIRRLIIFSCLLVGLGVQGCGEKSSQMTFVPIDSLGASEQSGREAEAPKKDSIVARVNGKAILLTDFQEAVQQLEEAGPNVSSAGAAYGAGGLGGHLSPLPAIRTR